MDVPRFQPIPTKKARRIPNDEAAQFLIQTQLFEKDSAAFPRDMLVYLMDNLIAYFHNGYCDEWKYWKLRRAFQAEWVRRLNTKG